ncbi:MAG: phosphatase PAP2 family protein [Nocardioides sp.]
MYRRAYTLVVGLALVMGGLAILVAVWKDKGLTDPDGFLGPSWLRLPMLIGGAFLADLLPRALWQSRMRFQQMPEIVRTRIRSHWTRDRVTLVVLGVLCFYITYVSYRNLKSFLPFVRPDPSDPSKALDYDRELHLLDRVLFFGNDPSNVMHTLLGTSFSAHFLSYIYLWFLPMVPLTVTAWLVWSRNLSFGYWFVTAQGIAWTLGTVSYYALPTLGPGFEYPSRYADLSRTPTNDLMYSLYDVRKEVLLSGVEDLVQSVAGFASLHVAITLLLALMVQFTLRSKVLHWVCWINFGLTIIATIYFGWHYIADDVAGIMIALIAFYLGGLASGQKFERQGRASHPTTTTSAVPVERV